MSGIINLGSFISDFQTGYISVYSGSKGYIENMTKSI